MPMWSYSKLREISCAISSSICSASWLEMAVVDNGAGMDAERVKRALHGGYSSKASGTGLGLSICYGIIKEHGGEIEVEGRQPHGATFRVRLPAAAVAEPARA